MAYAIFKTGGKQYKVQEGDKIDVEKIDVEVGGEASFGEILLIGDGGSTKIGDPVIEGASVTAEVLDQYRAKKVTAFKFKRRKGYHKTKGHRQPLTRLQIKSISA
ncbi:MAG: 50S ribosomal protein L21 [Verrucomicrobiales bacterium]